MTAVLETKALATGYGTQPVVHELNLQVEAGEVVALFGANGAGKTTTLLALSGELPVFSGEVLLDGHKPPASVHRRARQGLGFITEERSIFRGLSTSDNLRAGSVSIGDALELFPELEPRLTVRAGLLSGGEQQMLTLARALARKPRLLLADELSLGLAPLIVRRLLEQVRRAADDQQTGVLLVEQHVRKALAIADRGYVIQRGRIVLEGTSDQLLARLSEIEDSYLATGESVQEEEASGE